MSDVRRPRDDRGFTLIETVVVVVLMAVIATVLAATVSVILRTTGPTGTRADDSRTLHGLNIWLAQDASATAPNAFQIPGSLTECGGSILGTSLVKMAWTEDTGTPVNYVANYRHVDQGGGDFRVDRYTCSGIGAGPYGNTAILNLGSDLPATLPQVTPVLDGPDVIGVEFEVFTVDGTSIFIDGDSRNPSETLPSTTTSTTTTTLPPCDLVGSPTAELAISPNPVANQAGGGARPLTVAVTVTIETTGSCSDLKLYYNRGHGGPQQEMFVGAGPIYTVTLEADPAQRWTDGSHPFDVFDGGVGPLNEGSYALVVS